MPDDQAACDPVTPVSAVAAAPAAEPMASSVVTGSNFGELLDKVFDEHQRVVGLLQVELTRLQGDLTGEAVQAISDDVAPSSFCNNHSHRCSLQSSSTSGTPRENALPVVSRPEDVLEPEPPQALPPQFVVDEADGEEEELTERRREGGSCEGEGSFEKDAKQEEQEEEEEVEEVQVRQEEEEQEDDAVEAVKAKMPEESASEEEFRSPSCSVLSASSLFGCKPGEETKTEIVDIGESIQEDEDDDGDVGTQSSNIVSPGSTTTPPRRSLFGNSLGTMLSGSISASGPKTQNGTPSAQPEGEFFRPRRSKEDPDQLLEEGVVRRLSTQQAAELSAQKAAIAGVRSSLTLPRNRGGDGKDQQVGMLAKEVSRTGSFTTMTTEAFTPRRSTIALPQLGENVFMLYETWNDLAEEFMDQSDEDLNNADGHVLMKRRSTRDLRRLASYGEVLASKCNCKNWITTPTSRWRLAWDLTSVCLLSYDLLTVPMLVFQLEGTVFEIVSYTSSVWWTLDLVSSFFVGYHTIGGTVEMRPRKVWLRYLKTWFSMDVILVSLDWLVLILGVGRTKTGTLRIGKFTRGMRAFRLLRLIKLRYTFSDLLARAQSEYQRTVMHIAKLITFIVAVNHFIACGFYGLSHLTESNDTWVNKNFESDDPITYRYWTSMHWSLTQFTPASMEVVPVNTIERFYTVCALLFALITFSSFVSSITTAMTYLRTINARKMEQDTSLRRYLHEHSISPPLTTRVLHYFQDREQENRRAARMKEQDCELFQSLPESLKHDLRIESFTPVLLTHPLFSTFNSLDPKVIQAICKTAISERRLIIRDELFSAHSEDVSHMLFVHEGELSYKYEVNKFVVDDKIRKGEWAAEVALWAKNISIFGPFLAMSNCELIMIDRAEFMTTVTKFQKAAGQIAHYAELFVEEAVELCKRCRWQTVVMGDHDSCQDLVHKAFNKGTTRGSRTSSTSIASRHSRGGMLGRLLHLPKGHKHGHGSDVFSPRASRHSQGREGASPRASRHSQGRDGDGSASPRAKSPDPVREEGEAEYRGNDDGTSSMSSSRRNAAKAHYSERNGSQLVRFSVVPDEVKKPDRSSVGSFTMWK